MDNGNSANKRTGDTIFRTQINNNQYTRRQPAGKFQITERNVFPPKPIKKIKEDYHEQRLSQSKWAFRLSIFASILGFIVILMSICYGICTESSQWPGIVSGIVIETVSVLFYNMSNQTNEKISEFFQELTKDSNVQDSLKLVSEIENSDIADELRVKLSLHLSGIDETKICKNTKDICEKNN